MPDKQNSIMMCTDAAQKNPLAVPSGKSILQAWSCYPASQSFANKSDDELINISINELIDYFPELSKWTESTKVIRHKYGVPQFKLHHNQDADLFLKAVRKRNGISFCGDYLTGGYMESALWSAETVAANLVE